MTNLLSVIAPIFVLIAVGFAAVRTGYVPERLIDALGAFVLNFALPALILNALLRQDLQRTLDWSYLTAYAASSLAVFVAMLALFRGVLGRPMSHAAVAALGASASNSGFVGFPVAALALGAPALTALPLSMLVENILIIPLALALAEIGSGKGGQPGELVRQTLRRLARTPLIIAILAGTVLAAFSVRLPQPLAAALDMMANAAVPCALFVVGGTLAGLRAASVAGDVVAVAVGKLVLHPLAVGAMFLLVGGTPAGLMAAGIILASSPMLTIYPIIGARFGHGGMCAAALLAATTASFITLIFVLALVLPGTA